jgi:hypothetical protein
VGSLFSGAGEVRLNPINLDVALPSQSGFEQLKREAFLALGGFGGVVGGGVFVGFLVLGGVDAGVDCF